MELCGDAAIDFVDVKRVESLKEAICFRSKPRDSLVTLALFRGCGFPQGTPDKRENIVIDVKPSQDGRKLLVEDLLADIGLGAARFEPRAMIVDVLPFLDLRCDGAAAMSACDEAGEREGVLVPVDVRDASSVEDVLHVRPGSVGRKGRVRTLIELAQPLERPGVEPVSKDAVDRASA